MPRKSTIERAKKDLRKGKAPTTAAGEFVREEIEHVPEGSYLPTSRLRTMSGDRTWTASAAIRTGS
jgi:hypothetical protein